MPKRCAYWCGYARLWMLATATRVTPLQLARGGGYREMLLPLENVGAK